MNITTSFTYNLPDEYLAQTSELNKTATLTYSGPHKLFVFVDRETGLLQIPQSFMPSSGKAEEIEIANIRAGLDKVAVLLSPLESNLDALIASFYIGVNTSPESGHPQKEYALDDGTVYYSRPDPTSPDHTYDTTQIYYDLENGNWKTPFPWKLPHITMEQHVIARDSIVAGTQNDLDENGHLYTQEMKDAVQEFIDGLMSCYDVYENAEAHMIPFPADIKVGWRQDYDYNLDPENLLGPDKLPKQ
jgi:hypothetical protein